ncbi:MAG: phosphoenolpyruvate carboxykinase (ATP) [Candidatus Calescibacterium sp.]|nr:phosphoenolpyruvate carboxykinase (ATP) [Candidatus Calescibacterium sp.]MCX7972790.1 phosphoenolpyruvate carboxykinase (ATP) [bacterium]MDW8195864.1 phosphoenolpyruvate carboxykinase (ATP) [Candidatus Calescibacterium sp.]
MDSLWEKLLKKPKRIFDNLSVAELYEHTVIKNLGVISSSGSLIVNTSPYTGRSPKDKFIVYDDYTKDLVWWGNVNHPIERPVFNNILNKALSYLEGKDIYRWDGYVGANPDYTLTVTLLSEIPYHVIFANNLFIRRNELKPNRIIGKINILHLPNLKLEGPKDGVNSEVAIILDLYPEPFIFIAGTLYCGEIKKAVFTFLNYFYLEKFDILPMHCGANRDLNSMSTALFFGLSGTGKTTLSTDPSRRLIGDDEHGWTENDVFNFEGGSYAKIIKLDFYKEREIYLATNRFGTIVENVVYDPITREIDFSDSSITENTRSAYPNKYIEIMEQTLRGEIPETIFFLSADATGSLPPISILEGQQILEYFLLGYTSRLAGTERGVKDPEPTFSEAFSKPFLPLNPIRYANKLYEKIRKYNTTVYLINTGWIGNKYPLSNRIQLEYTRHIIRSALSKKIDKKNSYIHPVFGFRVPIVEGLPLELFRPHNLWQNEKEYYEQANTLKNLFEENLKRYRKLIG